ncbi:21152_t:CDS:2, partial [Gigaspora margarita]
MNSFGNYEIVDYDLYRGPNALEKFVDKLEVELAEIQADLLSLVEIIMEPGDYITFNETIECHICEKPFIDLAPEVLQQFKEAKYQLLEYKKYEPYMKNDHPKKKNMQKKYQQALSNLNCKVKDHDHISKKYRGLAHNASPEKQIVPKNWLSPNNERLVHDKEVRGRKYTSEEKLLQTLLPKKNYIVYYQVLQIYMKFGMKVTKILDYIEENIRKCKIAKANKEEFEVMHYKLKNNTVFRKQMENVRFKAFKEKITAVHMLKNIFDLDYFGDLFLIKDETKRDLIDKSVCLKLKMYLVLSTDHNPNTPKTEAKFKKDKFKKHGIQKAK